MQRKRRNRVVPIEEAKDSRSPTEALRLIPSRH